MVEISHDNNGHLLVLSPNKSMDWETNKKILLAMFVVAMVIGLSFAYIGAWLILPFAGLEITLVGIGMYYVCWKLNFKQTIRIQHESLRVQKGVYFPKQEWHWQKQHTSLLRRDSHYRMSAPDLYLKHLNEQIEIGEFLNRKEKLQLRQELVKLGLPMIQIKPR